MRTALLVLLIACAPALPKPDAPGAREAYRAALERDPKGPRAHEARERLEVAEWDAARKTHSVFAYRRFLEEFSDSHHAGEAKQLLEGLRWAEAERGGSEIALTAYLSDEPQGAHAAQAWTLLSQQRLEQALHDGSAPKLRTWLGENPAAPGRERALQQLDHADYAEAHDGPALRAYLEAHLDGAHRAEAQARLQALQRDEAEALEDEPKLRAASDPAADKLAFQRALALLDEGMLAQLARKQGPWAQDAARDLAELHRDPRRAGLLEAAAQRLYLPRPTLQELPEAAPERARRLREWAAALDGSRLHRMLSEIGSPRAQVALAALDATEALLKDLPEAEARIRARRELEALLPLAQDAPQLAQVAALQLALRQPAEALASARLAVGRDPRNAPAAWLQARLETEPGLQAVALQTLRAQAVALADAHAVNARAGDAAALGELCAAARAASRAAEVLQAPEPRADALTVQRAIEEGQRARGGAEVCALPAAASADERRAAVRTLADSGGALARAALARALARDPDATVRATAQGALASR